MSWSNSSYSHSNYEPSLGSKKMDSYHEPSINKSSWHNGQQQQQQQHLEMHPEDDASHSMSRDTYSSSRESYEYAQSKQYSQSQFLKGGSTRLQSLGEAFEDEESAFLRENVVVDEIFDNPEGEYLDEYADEAIEDQEKAVKRRRRVVLLVSVLFLGGMGGLIYWLYTVIAQFELPRDTDAVNQTFSSSVDSSRGSSQDRPSNDVSSAVLSVPPPPVAFNETCSRAGIVADQFNLFKCETMCTRAACCYVTETQSNMMMCRESDADVCAMYSPLCDFIFGPLVNHTSLDGNNNTASSPPEAPDDLLSQCDPMSGSAESCMDACYDGYCCFSSATSILVGSNSTMPSCYDRERCEGYMPCLLAVLSATTTVISTDDAPVGGLPAPVDNLPELCSDDSLATQIGAVKCMSHCKQAACCMDLDPITSCLYENIGTCSGYSPCSRILQSILPSNNGPDNLDGNGTNATETGNSTSGEAVSIVIPEPVENLGELCAVTSLILSVENLKECAMACENALCCFEEGQGSCLQENPSDCLKYTSCQALVEYKVPGGSISHSGTFGQVPFPEKVTISCSDESRSTELGRTACLQGCQPGLCCFGPHESCFDQNVFSCLLYSPCENVIDMNGTFDGIVPLFNKTSGIDGGYNVSLPPDNINDLCFEDSLLTEEGVNQCSEACSESACCTSDTNNCFANNSEACNRYGTCLNLLFIATESPTSAPSAATAQPASVGSPSGGTDGELEPPPNYLESVCHGGGGGFKSSDCYIACEEASCCFTSNATNCYTNRSDWCDLYALCEEVLNQDYRDSSILKRACDFKSNPDACIELCAEGTCCFEEPSCGANNPGFCDYYAPCSVVYDLTSGETSNTTNVLLMEVCDSSRVLSSVGAWQECSDSCEAGRCCYDTSAGGNGTCDNTTEFCLEYAPCLALSAAPPANHTTSINTVCASERLQSSNESHALCESLCYAGMCCFLPADDIGGCANDTSHCEGYQACAALSDLWTSSLNGPFYNPTVSPSPSQSLEPTSSLFGACAAEEVMLSDESYSLCESLCTDGLCCFLPIDDIGGCRNDTDHCEAFEACRVLFQHNVTVTTSFHQPSYNTNSMPTVSPSPSQSLQPTSHIDEICSAANIVANGLQSCRDICEDGLCCFVEEADGSSCQEDVAFCSEYAPCHSVFSNDTQAVPFALPPSIADYPSFAPSLTASPTGELDLACTLEAISDDTGRVECARLCADGVCCLVPENSSDACHAEIEFCSTYKACAILFVDDPEMPIDPARQDPLEVLDVASFECTQDVIDSQEGLQKCLEMCDTWSCCFDENADCNGNQEQACQQVTSLCDQL